MGANTPSFIWMWASYLCIFQLDTQLVYLRCSKKMKPTGDTNLEHPGPGYQTLIPAQVTN